MFWWVRFPPVPPNFIMTPKEFISNLKVIAHNYPKGDQPTFDCALRLMRAAEPKDPKAEIEHCRAAVRCLFNHELEQSSVRFIDVQNLIQKEREIARAEGYLKALEEKNALHTV